jgi:IS605 OrfB family transposase
LLVKVNTSFQFNKTLQVKLINNKLRVSQVIDVKEHENTGVERVGIDKNYVNVVATSNENIYGDKINEYYNEYTDYVTDKYKKRNKIGLVLKKHKLNNNTDKVNNIIKNNLGSKTVNNKKRQLKEQFKSLINKSLNDFIAKENPKEIVVENLNFQSSNKNMNRKAKHKLNTWSKGYVQERIEYKSKLNSIKIIKVSAAYTSQQCPECQWFFDSRDSVYCPFCGRGVLHHVDSASVVLNRSYDKEITLETPPNKVKQLLLDRNKALLELKTGATRTLDVTKNDHSKNRLSLNL